MKTSKGNLFLNIIHEKCPHCGKGKIFEGNAYPVFYLPKMHKQCDSCGYTFEREPG